MKRLLNAIVCIAMLGIPSYGFTDSNDTLSKPGACDSLQKQLNMINAKLDKVWAEMAELGYQAEVKRENKKWGGGWNICGQATTLGIGGEGGYIHKTQNGAFLGTFIGMEGRLGSWGPPLLGYLKLLTATPIFSGCFSLQLNMIPTCYFGDRTFGGGKNAWWGFGLQPQIACWLNPRSCIALGVKGTLSKRKEVTEPNTLKGEYTWYDLNVAYTYTIRKK
jgi:hypothetical protein